LLAQKEYKDSLGGYISFGQAFNTGFKYSLFSGFLLAIFFYVYLAFLNPGALDKAAEQQQTVLAEKNMSQEQIDQAIEMTKKYGAMFGAVAAAIGSLISGCIIALITAAILKKERSAFDAVDTTADEPTVLIINNRHISYKKAPNFRGLFKLLKLEICFNLIPAYSRVSMAAVTAFSNLLSRSSPMITTHVLPWRCSQCIVVPLLRLQGITTLYKASLSA
jgi:hypothetical protein